MPHQVVAHAKQMLCQHIGVQEGEAECQGCRRRCLGLPHRCRRRCQLLVRQLRIAVWATGAARAADLGPEHLA